MLFRSVCGYFIMRKYDLFLTKNRRCIDAEITENSLLIAFDNPLIIDSLMPLFEQFLRINPDCQLHFLFGNTEDIYDSLIKNDIDIAFLKCTASEDEDTCNYFIISPKQNCISCENTGCPIEPLNPGKIQTVALWKKVSGSAFASSFSDLLLSDQAAVNAGYVK